MDPNEFHSIVNPDTETQEGQMPQIPSEILGFMVAVLAKRAIQNALSHDCNNCDKAGQCPAEEMVRKIKAAHKENDNETSSTDES